MMQHQQLPTTVPPCSCDNVGQQSHGGVRAVARGWGVSLTVTGRRAGGR